MTNLNICPSGSVIGARVLNVSLCDVPSAGTVEEIEQALENYGVLVFPNQSPKPQQLIDFSAVFAPLEKTELEKARLEGFEEIFVVGNEAKDLYRLPLKMISRNWSGIPITSTTTLRLRHHCFMP